MSDGLKFWGVLFAITIGLFVVIGTLAIVSNKYQCEKYNEATGRDTKLVAQTCYTKVQGEWYPVSQVRVIK